MRIKIMKRMTSAICAALICISAMSGCSSSKLYTSDTSGYKEITDIPGVKFVVPNSVAQATVINQISGNMEFDSNTTYSYKDGVESYIVFNMNNIVILVQKGTSFGFDQLPAGEDKTSCLNNSSILGTWLKSQNGEELSYEEDLADGVYKLIATTQAGVTITTELFGDFMGDLAVVTDGTTEYALFMGAPVDLYNELNGNSKSMIETVAMSLAMTSDKTTASDLMSSSNSASTQADVENSADTSAEQESSNIEASSEASVEAEPVSDEAAKEETTEVLEEEITPDAESSTESSIIEDNAQAADLGSSTEEISEAASEEVSIEVTESGSEEETQPLEEEDAKETEETEAKGEEDQGDDSAGMNLNNQREYAKANETDPSYTDIYSTAEIGDKVYFQTTNGEGELQLLTVTLNKVYDKDESEKLIRQYCTNGSTGYGYTDAPDGCHWEAAEFEVAAVNGGVLPDIYTDVKFTGLDGEKLNFKGISYSMRTYNLMNGSSVIVYYAVPNGCNDYLLRVGDTIKSEDVTIINAYYEIK